MKHIHPFKKNTITAIVILTWLFPGSSHALAQCGVQTAGFTNAIFTAQRSVLATNSAEPFIKGTLKEGIYPDKPVTLTKMKLNPAEGLIEVWIQPQWSGSDGKSYRLWQTSKINGRQLTVEKSALGMLRAELSTPLGLTVARADVKSWNPGEWHHIAVGWISNQGKQVGLALWIDKVAVDGPVTPYGVFDPAAIPDTLILGDGSGSVVFDELVIRSDLDAEGPHGMIACIYRDYLRTAPYDKLQIDPEPTRVPSDLRAVARQEKQFGLLACKQGNWEPVTEQVVRYSQWAYFDAKPLIRWSTSDPGIAKIDSTGRVRAFRPGRCKIIAEFHDMKVSYQLTVIPADRPDIGIICMGLTPLYKNEAAKDRPEAGESVTVHVRFGNFGNKPVEPGTQIRFSLIPDSNGNYQPDKTEKPVNVMTSTFDRPLSVGEEAEVTFRYPFPGSPTWMKAELDYNNHTDELCEANNSIVERCDARPIQIGFKRDMLRSCFTDDKINHVGSFSYYDWLRAEKQRMDLMLREAVWTTTGSNGVEEAYRIDAFTALTGVEWDDEPYNKKMIYYDGGFPVDEPVDLMSIDCAIIHEFGHTILSQPDLYGYPMSRYNVFITDDHGNPAAGTPVMPVVNGDYTLQASGGINVACHVGYPSLMDGCQLWLHPSQAGHIMYYKGYRQDRFWGTQGMLIPTRANWIFFKDVYDRPLANAAVYVYHVSQAPVQDSGAKYFSDRPKFIGQTDAEGRFTFPGTTDEGWDDAETDTVDGAIEVWNPFTTKTRTTAFTPNVWSVEGLLLVRIVAGEKTEYHFMDMTQFNTEFLAGNRVCGKYTIYTSLSGPALPTPIVRKPIPEKIRHINKQPVAVVPETMEVRCGEEFEIDGSASYDPEGQPLLYRWNTEDEWLNHTLSQSSVMKVKAPDTPEKLEYKFWVLDGIRCSEPRKITVNVIR